MGSADEDLLTCAIRQLATDLAEVLDDRHSVAFLERVAAHVPLVVIGRALRDALGAGHDIRSPRAYFASSVRRYLPPQR